MLKQILMMFGIVVVNYVPVWAADQFDQIIGNAERPQQDIEKDSP